MAEVNRPDVDLDRVEELIATDPTLAYGLLRQRMPALEGHGVDPRAA